MSAPKFLSSALRATTSALSGGETIGIGGAEIPAVLDPETNTEDLMLGGDGDHRVLTLLIRSADLPDVPAKGESVTARGQDWTVNQVEHHPLTTTRLTLHAPMRRES